MTRFLAVLPQDGELAMAYGIVLFLPVLNLDGQGFIEFGSLRLEIQTATGDAKQFHQLTFIDGLPRSPQRAGQCHSVLFAH
ncbi:MAG: hypothetical protein ACJ8BW_14015 [Ktedonobacteraceae bacterium]